MLKARLTHLAVFVALSASALVAEMGWLGYSDGVW
jgi:hypothetical protein